VKVPAIEPYDWRPLLEALEQVAILLDRQPKKDFVSIWAIEAVRCSLGTSYSYSMSSSTNRLDAWSGGGKS
jgi:hypothetical protein